MAYAASHDLVEGHAAKVASSGKSWFGRFVDAVVESRERSARREIARHQFFVSDTRQFMKGVDPNTLPFED